MPTLCVFIICICRYFLSIFYILSRRKPGETKLVYDRIKKQLARIRNRQYPKLPTKDESDTVIDFHRKHRTVLNDESIRKEFGRTLDNRHKLYFGSFIATLFAFHVFVSTTVIDMIQTNITKEKLQTRRYLMDGTFSIFLADLINS